MPTRIILLIFLLYACSEKKKNPSESSILPKVVEAKGDVVPRDRMAEPVVIPVDESKLIKIPAGNPKMVLDESNVHTAGKPLVVLAGKPLICTPGQNGYSLPVLVSAVGSTFLVKQPECVPASLPRVNHNATCNIQYMDVNQGMSSSMVTKIIEDRQGNIWICTPGEGMSKYNGITFSHFTDKEGLINKSVWSAIEDRAGNLWFGSDGGAVSRFDGKSFTHYYLNRDIDDNKVWAILEDKGGNLWFGTNGGGVVKYNGKSFVHYTKNQGLPDNIVMSILEDKKGNIWFGTSNGGISKFDGKSFMQFTGTKGLSQSCVTSMTEDKFGNLWFGTIGGGAVKFDGISFAIYTTKEGLMENNVYSILEDNRGNLWFGNSKGSTKYDLKNFTYFTEKEGLSNNIVRSILEDKSGNIWFGTQGRGISKFSVHSFQVKIMGQGNSNSIHNAIFQDKSGGFWFGTNGGGVTKYEKTRNCLAAKITDFRKKDGLSDNYISSILEDERGHIWFGTFYGGITRYEPQKEGRGATFIHFSKKEGFSGDIVSSMLEDKSGNIWFGTHRGGVFKYELPRGKNTGRFIQFKEEQGLSHNIVRSMLEDQSGNLWFGTNGGGITKYDGKCFTHFTEKHGLGSNYVVSILEDKRGNLWFGTINGGVSKFDGKSFTNYSESAGLSNKIVWSILEDTSGNIWFGTQNGLNCLKSDNGNFENNTNREFFDSINPGITVFHEQDGLRGENFLQNASLLDRNNCIWWCTGKGLNMLDLNTFRHNETTPKMQMESVLLQEKFVDFNNLASDRSDSGKNLQRIRFRETARFHNYPVNPELPYEINHLTFQYSAIDWYAPHKLKYQYKLEGLDEQWSRLTAENQADYRNIPFGRFTFKVKAIGSAGKWSNIVEYPFIIHPPWWRTWWAYALYFLAGLGGIAGLIRFREKSLRRRQQELQEKVTEATGEIREQKQVIEEKHRQVLDSIEYARRIQNSILPPQKIVQQYLEESFILYLPKDIVAGDFYWMTEVEGVILFAACDCTGHGVPGAMVSVVCSNALNKTVKELGITEPGRMLDKVSDLVRGDFHRSGAEDEFIRDGMDISLCRLDLKNRHLQWAGANNPLWIVRKSGEEQELIEVKADRQSVGSNGVPFLNHEVKLQPGDSLYLFSDGYSDQLGGESGKKFTKKRLRELLLQADGQPMSARRELLLQTHLQWRAGQPQTDDICVIGVGI